MSVSTSESETKTRNEESESDPEMATLTGLPLEILESIALTIAEQDIRAAVSLTLVNSECHHKFESAQLFWRRLCQVLEIEVFKGESGSWKSAFDTFLAEEKSWKSCTRLSYDIFGKTKALEPEIVDGEEFKKNDKIEGLVQKYRSRTKKAVRAQIRLSTYASTYDEKYFVVCHSEQMIHVTTITVWEIASGRQIHEGTVDFELASQDIIVWMGHFVCLPLWPEREYGDPEVRGYDLSVDTQDFQHPSWKVNVSPEMVDLCQRPIPPQRYYPKRYKDSGANRILKHEDYLVLVLPMKYEIHENRHGQWIIQLWKGVTNETHHLTGIVKVDGQFAAPFNPWIQVQYTLHDQKGDNFVFCFYNESPNGIYPFRRSEPVGSHFITMRISKTNMVKEEHISSCVEPRFCRHRIHLLVEMVKMCNFGYPRGRRPFDGERSPYEMLYNLRQSVERIRMYTAAVGSKTRKMSPTNNFVQESSCWSMLGDDRRGKTGDLYSPAIYVIQANGKIGSFIGYESGGRNFDRKTIPWQYRDNPLMSAGKVYNQDNWYFNEIVSCDVDNVHKMIVMQKFADGMSLFAIADDENLSHLWTIALNETNLNPDNRLYLKQCLGAITIADSSGVHLFSSGSGKSLGAIKFQTVNKVLPDVDPEDADESFYAQTGLGIWDVKCVGVGESGGKDTLLVIHDLERCAPVFFDAYKF